MSYRTSLIFIALPAFALTIGCTTNGETGGTAPKLVAECVDDATDLEGWLCPDDLTVECEDGGADPDVVYFEPSGDEPPECDEIDYVLND